jgi:biopolymer transport protein TolR
MTTPKINVTPLIDVLLVLLVIFMVVAPLKPGSFAAKIPREPKLNDRAYPNPYALVVTIASDQTLSLNEKRSLGNLDNPAPLIEELKRTFKSRAENGAVDERGDVVKTVFIKAPKKLGYGSVVKMIDAVKEAGAEPIALQIDYLN